MFNNLVLVLLGIRCYDKRSECPSWARRGDCQTNGYVERVCRISCKKRCDLKEPRPAGEIWCRSKGVQVMRVRQTSKYGPNQIKVHSK